MAVTERLSGTVRSGRHGGALIVTVKVDDVD